MGKIIRETSNKVTKIWKKTFFGKKLLYHYGLKSVGWCVPGYDYYDSTKIATTGPTYYGNKLLHKN